MSSQFIGFLSVFFLVYCAGNYYIGLRLFQSFRGLLEPHALLFWAGYIVLAVSPFVARLGRTFFPGIIDEWITVIGNYWLAALYYFLLIWVLADGLRLIGSLAWPEALSWKQPSLLLGVAVAALVCGLLAFGVWNARNPRITHYDITINKAVPGLTKLRAVLVSDIHLGVIVGNDRLADLVDRINALNPDIVFFAGDTIDEDVSRFVEQKMPEALGKLRTRYGGYVVLGNHEYLGGNSELAVEQLELAGLTVLQDRYVKINDQFYVVGRDDLSVNRMTGKGREELAKVMEGVDGRLPIFLLDHQPFRLEEGQRNGVDLQVSGHTHHGQFFPNNLLTERIFETDWGYRRKGDYQAIVSCGYGTWGPPIRIGNYPEIVDIAITFAGPGQ